MLRVDGVDGGAAGKGAAELDHALGEADVAEALVALVARGGRGGAAAAAAARAAGQGGDRGIVEDLVVEGVVRGAEAGVVDGEEAELGGDDGGRGRGGGGGWWHGGAWLRGMVRPSTRRGDDGGREVDVDDGTGLPPGTLAPFSRVEVRLVISPSDLSVRTLSGPGRPGTTGVVEARWCDGCRHFCRGVCLLTVSPSRVLTEVRC